MEQCRRVAKRAAAAGQRTVALCFDAACGRWLAGQRLATVDIQSPAIPVLHNADVASHAGPREIRRRWVPAIVQPGALGGNRAGDGTARSQQNGGVWSGQGAGPDWASGFTCG